MNSSANKNSSSNNDQKFIFLEALRGVVALYVFFHHAKLVENSGFGRLMYFGQEAVIIFFILSGFVISYSSGRRLVGVGEYLFLRVRRIYPIFLVALILAYLSASVRSGGPVPVNFESLFGNFLMLQDVGSLKNGVWFDTYYGNSPLWSLSYEWWFYMAYVPVAMSGWFLVSVQFYVVLFVSVVGFLLFQWNPQAPFLYSSYFIIWWMGVSMAREYSDSGEISFRVQAKAIFWLAMVSLFWVYAAVRYIDQGGEFSFGVGGVLHARHFLAALFFSVCAVLFFRVRVQFPRSALNAMAEFSKISYFIYVAHWPILGITDWIFSERSALSVFFAFIVVVCLGWFFEVIVQGVLQKKFNYGNLIKFFGGR